MFKHISLFNNESEGVKTDRYNKKSAEENVENSKPTHEHFPSFHNAFHQHNRARIIVRGKTVIKIKVLSVRTLRTYGMRYTASSKSFVQEAIFKIIATVKRIARAFESDAQLLVKKSRREFFLCLVRCEKSSLKAMKELKIEILLKKLRQ
jgi:hypothetical protein